MHVWLRMATFLLAMHGCARLDVKATHGCAQLTSTLYQSSFIKSGAGGNYVQVVELTYCAPPIELLFKQCRSLFWGIYHHLRESVLPCRQ